MLHFQDGVSQSVYMLNDGINPNSFNLVFYQHALQLCLCLLLGLLCSSRRVTELGLRKG